MQNTHKVLELASFDFPERVLDCRNMLTYCVMRY